MAAMVQAASTHVAFMSCGHVAASHGSSRLSSSHCGLRKVSVSLTRVPAAMAKKSRMMVRMEAKGMEAKEKKEAKEPHGGAGAVTDATFKSLVLESDVPVLVDFWAPWCGPCRMIAPLIDELSVQYAGKLRCVKINTDESPSVATEYGIRSIPTVMIFKKGKKLDTVIGAVPKSTLTTTIEKYLD